jgi:hypothetical protein
VKKARKRKRTVYEMSRIKTRAMKSDVPRDLWPLFDHMFVLAADSHKRGYVKRAGIELAHARRLARFGKR